MIKKSLKMILPLLLIFLMIGSISANVVNNTTDVNITDVNTTDVNNTEADINYTEINKTVEHNTTIDEPPVINSTQKLINVENKTYDNKTVTNETISNTTHEEQKIIGYNTRYIHIPNGGYDGSEIDYVLLENGSNITYDSNKKLSCSNGARSKCVNATLHLENGTVFDIVIHNEGNDAYQNFLYRQDVPIYENVTVFDITNRITTFVDHITEVLYQVIDIPQPIPPTPVNNTTDVNITDINTTDVNNTEIVINNTIDEPSIVVADNNISTEDVEVDNPVDVVKMENTGGLIAILVLVILVLTMTTIYVRK